MSNKYRHVISWLVLAIIAVAASVASLSLNSVRISVETKDQTLTISLLDKTLAVPLTSSPVQWEIGLRSLQRYSTLDLLFQESSNPLMTGFSLLLHFFDPKPKPITCNVPDCSFAFFNPFQTRLTFHAPPEQLELGLDMTNGELVVFRDEHQISSAQSNTHYLSYTFLLIIPPILIALSCFCLTKIFTVLFSGVSSLRGNEQVTASAASSNFFVIPLIFFIGFAVIYLIQLFVSKRLPGFGDEMNYLFQGKIFASGRMSVPEGAFSEFFNVSWMDMFGKDGKIWDFHPPGNSLILALGWIVGCYWITVPIIAGLILVVQFLLGVEIFGNRKLALWYLLFFFSSHYILSLASSFMAHAPSLLFLSISFLAFVRFCKDNRNVNLYVMALCLGLAFTIRPVSAVLMGIIPGFIVLKKQILKSPLSLFKSAILFLIPASFIFVYAYQITSEFNFPYLLKGPEVGQTLLARLSRGYGEQFRSLYRNVNELAHRAHSFGAIGNLVPFFIALIASCGFGKRPFIRSMQLTFILYVLGHSALHWYGWKWEPRMLYDASFLFFLASFEGLLVVYRSVRFNRAGKSIYLCVALAVSGYLLFRDLPLRFTTEYSNYNSSPSGVWKFISKNEVHNSIFFFENETAYATYFPFNEVGFDGDIIFALSKGVTKNATLMSRYPSKQVYYTQNGEEVTKIKNFFEKDFERLTEWSQSQSKDSIFFILPWKKYLDQNQLSRFHGEIVEIANSISALPSMVKRVLNHESLVIVLVGESTQIEFILQNVFSMETIPLEGYETLIKAFRLTEVKEKDTRFIPGFTHSCYNNLYWDPPGYLTTYVPNIDIDLCPGENQSLEWRSTMKVTTDSDITFFTESDDGSGIFIDNVLVLDNSLTTSHGRLKISKTVHLEKGNHDFRVRYFNGPAQAFLQVGLITNSGQEIPLYVRPDSNLSFWVDYDRK